MDIQTLNGIGLARAKAFARLGLFSVSDLLTYYPAGYQDRTAFKPVCELTHGGSFCVTCMITQEPRESRIRQGLSLTKTQAVDSTGRLYLTFFNAPYVKNSLIPGETYVFFGKAELKNNRVEMVNPVFEPDGADKTRRVTGRLMPVYRLTHGLPQHVMRQAVRQAVDLLADSISDVLPRTVRQRHSLCHCGYALRQIHAPDDPDSLNMAKRRLAFEEFFLLALGLSWLKRSRTEQPGHVFCGVPWRELEDALPFELTGAQHRVISECSSDLSSGRLMNRLVQGDVGSGKTAVAAALCLTAARSGFQSALMTPTELLAVQHYANLRPLMERWSVSCALLTGKLTPKEKKAVQNGLADGSISFVVGTHALLSKNVSFARPGLIVTDEQHRFGVAQRTELAAKASSSESSPLQPHMLVMSATPIPRTLALLLYGELDLSVLDELPPGREQVRTYAVDEDMRPRIDGFILKTVREGGQVYVVCPMIERIDDDGVGVTEGLKEAVAVRDRLAALFPDIEIGLAHGRMKARDREIALERFRSGEVSVLVATTVIEVGVDVPNAALMVVENADRFGLAQLHQLRGRVGRGSRRSYCVLMAAPGSGELARKRLSFLEKSGDGFAIADADLTFRGPGEFFGTRQHGLPVLRVADMSSDVELLHEARLAASELLDSDPALSSYPALREHADKLMRKLGG